MRRLNHSTHRRVVTYELPRRTLDRLNFWAERLGTVDPEELIERVVHCFDMVACATIIERSKVVIHHRSGSWEEITVTQETDGKS